MLFPLASAFCFLLPWTNGDATGPRETVLLVNDKPLDLEWDKCLNTRACIKANVIDRVADLESKAQNMTFGNVPEREGTFINLSSRLKMKMIQKEDGKIAFRFVANNNAMETSRGHMAEKHKALLIGFSLILFVLGVVSTTLKVNVFLALLGVAVGKLLLLYVYTEHLHHKYHGHHHGHPTGLHIHKAPTYYRTHAPVQVIEQVPDTYEVQHDVYDHAHHHYEHAHDHYDHEHDHYPWDIIRKKKSMDVVASS